MNERMLKVMQRRGVLLGRIAGQRQQISQVFSHWAMPLTLVDQGLLAFRFLRNQPLLVGGIAALLLWRRHGLIGLLGPSSLMWRGYRHFVSVRSKLAGRPD